MAKTQTAPPESPETSEPEVIDVEVIEETDEGQPTLAEYEAAKETIRVLLSTSPPNGEMAAAQLEVEEAHAYAVVDRAERYGIKASQGEDDVAGVTVSMLPSIRDAVATQAVEVAHPVPSTHALPSKVEWEAAMAVAREIAKTQFVPKEIRGKPDQVLACILTGRELGIGPMYSLAKIHMIDGRPAFSAELMLSLMRKGGVVLLETEATMEHALIKAKRSDTGEIATVEFTWAEAQLIDGGKLVNKTNWKNYRQDMLWARCVSRLARRLAPDLLGGMSYSAEEVADFDDQGSYTSMATEGTEAANAVQSVTFRPGVDLLDKAPRNFEDTAELLKTIDPAQDWSAWGSAARTALFGQADFKQLTDDQKVEFGRRMANTASYLADEILGGKDFPPPTHDQIRQAFAWGFEGAALTVGVKEDSAAEQEATKEEPEPVATAGGNDAPPELDPGVDLLSNAVPGSDAEAVQKVYSDMTEMNDDVDWSGLISLCVTAQYGVAERTDLEKAQHDEWWLRLRNAVARMELEASVTEGLRSSTVEQVTSAFKWAYPKLESEVPLKPKVDDPGPEIDFPEA